MTCIPSFEKVFSDDWLDDAFVSGRWDATHGSGINRLICDIQSGAGWLPPCPAGMLTATYEEVRASEAFRSTIKSWLRSRYDNLCSHFEAMEVIQVARTMTVDEAWLPSLMIGEATMGIYFGEIPLDDGGFWIDENKPLEVYFEADVTFDQIDWEGTLRARIDYVTGDEEREIRLKVNTNIVLKNLMLDCEEITECNMLQAGTGDGNYVTSAARFIMRR